MNLSKANLIKYGSYLTVILAPCVFWSHLLYAPISSKTFFIYGAVEVIFFTWLYLASFDHSYRLSKKDFLLFLPLICFVVWMTIASIFAVDSKLAFWSSLARGTGLLSIYHFLAFSLIVFSLIRKYGIPYLVAFLQSFVLGSFILTLSLWFGTEGFNLLSKFILIDAGGGLTGNSSVAGGYLIFSIGLALFLLSIKSVNFWRKIIISIVVFLIVSSPVFFNLYGFFSGKGILGGARGATISILLSIFAFFLGYIFLSARKSIRVFSIFVMVICMGVFGYLWMQFVNPDTNLHKRFTVQEVGSRFTLWDIARVSISERPIIGYGPENYSIAFQAHFNPMTSTAGNLHEGWADKAHNLYYDLGVSGGYPAIILYIVFLLSILYSIYRAYEIKNLTRIQGSIIFALLVAYIFNNLFVFDSNLSMLSLFIVTCIVYSFNTQKQERKIISQSNVTIKYIVGGVLFLIFLTTSIYFVYRPVVKAKAYVYVFTLPIAERSAHYKDLLKGSDIGNQWDSSAMAYNVVFEYGKNLNVIKNDPKVLPYVVSDMASLLDYLGKIEEKNKTDNRLYLTMNYIKSYFMYLATK